MTDTSKDAVQRFTVTRNSNGLGCSDGIDRSDDGFLVAYRDYEALRAKLAKAEATAPKVKPLVWEGELYGLSAKAMHGNYHIEYPRDGMVSVENVNAGFSQKFENEEAAKAAANDHHRAAIMAALELDGTTETHRPDAETEE